MLQPLKSSTPGGTIIIIITTIIITEITILLRDTPTTDGITINMDMNTTEAHTTALVPTTTIGLCTTLSLSMPPTHIMDQGTTMRQEEAATTGN